MVKVMEKETKILPINELYTAIQGEGCRAGMPTIVVRTTGCTHRCFFGDGGWCDAWRNSIHPEKGKYTYDDIRNIYSDNPQISEMMLTGGSPTMHMKMVNNLNEFAKVHGIVVTLESEGSHKLELERPIDLYSLSPKLSNSVPKLGTVTPKGKVVDQKFIDQHNKFRLNYDVMRYNIEVASKDYQIKPVWDGSDKVLDEIFSLCHHLNVPFEKVYLMPAGDNREELIKMYPIVIETAIKYGMNFTGRPHIIAYDTKREV